jgi:hypothetical protein
MTNGMLRLSHLRFDESTENSGPLYMTILIQPEITTPNKHMGPS